MLAVSGGADSMTLMHAVARELAERGSPGATGRVVVATFDHGTGEPAREAVAHVRRWATAWGLPVISGASPRPISPPGEASWRQARWAFLCRVARAHRGAVVTAHTRDDHVETIVMRVMRGSGARGLSALHAPSPIRRPLLQLGRSDILDYARVHDLEWVDDPSNSSRRHFRNRVRLDLLPALRAADPSLEEHLLSIAERAGELRRQCAEAVAPFVVASAPGRVVVEHVSDEGWPAAARALFWQSVAERGGIALDWRGTDRLVHFATHGRGGRRIPLSGGYEAVHRREVIELRRRPATVSGSAELRSVTETAFGRFRFRPVSAIHPMPGGAPEESLPEVGGGGIANGATAGGCDAWSAWLPADATLEVRAWRAGDRMISSGNRARRVKRFLADCRVAAPDREGWPVVVANGEIVWIPGVRRGDAATVRPGRPRICFLCERLAQ